ncbi:UNVERIFIED_CONTAM: hypothetical protein Sindi_3123700, partial [Sesamum indicum]
RTDVGAVGIDGRGCLSPLVACDAEISSLWWAKCRQSRFWVRLLVAVACEHGGVKGGRDGLHPARGLGAGGGQGQGAPAAQASAVLMAWAGLCWPCFGSESPARDSGGALERGSTVLRAADAHLHRVRRMPSRPQRQAVGACFDCDLLKHGQHKPVQAKVGRSVRLCLSASPRISGPMRVPSGFDGRGCLSPLVACDAEISSLWWAKCRNPDFGALASSPLPANMEASRRPATACTPDRRLPVAPTQGGCGRRRRLLPATPRSVARGWRSVGNPGMQGSRTGAGYALGALASSPSPAKVEASHRQVGPVPRFLLLGSQLVLRPESSCLPGHAWACLLPFACRDARMRRGTAGVGLSARALPTTSPASRFSRRPKRAPALAAVGFLCCIPIAKAFHCPERPVFPALHPSGRGAGGPQGARCVPRPAHGRTCPGRWPIASSPDLSDAEHTVGTRPRPLFAPKASVRRFVRTTPATVLGSSHAGGGVGEECYLVDPASSHMLVSKIKPCIYSLFDGTCYSDNRSNSRANTCNKPRLLEGMHLLDKRSTRAPPVAAMIHDNSTDRTALWPTMVVTGDGELGFRFRRGSLRNGYHIQGRQQARKLPNPDTGRIHWRASLVPAAAVIPAPIAWTLGWAGRSASGVHRSSRPFCRRCAPGLNWPGRASGAVTLKKLECSKQAYALYTLAWDNIIGFRSYYVGLRDRKRKLGARRRSDTVLVSTINDADQGSADVAFRTPPAPYEKSKSLGSGGSMVARLKLKGIDGRAPPGVEPAA